MYSLGAIHNYLHECIQYLGCSLNLVFPMSKCLRKLSLHISVIPVITFNQETSLLRRLQGRPSTPEAPPIGKIHPFSKMAVTFEPLMGF